MVAIAKKTVVYVFVTASSSILRLVLSGQENDEAEEGGQDDHDGERDLVLVTVSTTATSSSSQPPSFFKMRGLVLALVLATASAERCPWATEISDEHRATYPKLTSMIDLACRHDVFFFRAFVVWVFSA